MAPKRDIRGRLVVAHRGRLVVAHRGRLAVGKAKLPSSSRPNVELAPSLWKTRVDELCW